MDARLLYWPRRHSKYPARSSIKDGHANCANYGGIVIGTLTVNYVTLSTPLKLHLENSTLKVQTGILDKLFKGLLPVAITLLAYYLINQRKLKSTTVLFILILIAAVGAGFYIF